MTKVTRTAAVFDNLAGFDVPAEVMLKYVDAVISQRALDGRDPARPEIDPPVLTNEEKANLFLRWVKGVIRQHAVEAAAIPSMAAAEAARAAANAEADTELGTDE